MKKKKKKIQFPIILFMLTLFMGIGYATVNSTDLSIAGAFEVSLPNEVIIIEGNYFSSTNADKNNSKINYIAETTLDSSIVLNNSQDSTITYQLTLYNNTDKEHIFIDAITDKTDKSLYSNTNIDFTYTKLENYVTTIKPHETLTFEVTFKYINKADLSKNTLLSKINFRFKEIPKIVLSNEGENYTFDEIYPGYTKEYQFTVSNFDSNKINNVPLTYSLITTINSPFTALIYDESGNLVDNNNITIDGDNVSEITHNYTLKIMWNYESNIDYTEYENKEFNCNVLLTVIPTDIDKYLTYQITKQFNVTLKAASFNFEVTGNTPLNMEKSGATLALTVNNFLDSDYNIFDTTYDVSIQDNDKFTLSIDSGSTRTISGGKDTSDTFNIKFLADINSLNVSETLTLKLTSISPYYKEIILPVTINLQPVTVTLNSNDGTGNTQIITVYKGKTYDTLTTPTWLGHTFDGWYSTESGGTKYQTTTEVTTTSKTQILYANWTSHLLADNVKIGDYVNININYNNVSTSATDGTYTPQDTYKYWRVLDIAKTDNEKIKYVKIVTAGVPMTYVHSYGSSGSTSVTNLTTNFFKTAINTTTATNLTFHRCGFLSGSTAITNINTLYTLFKNNTYTEKSSSGDPLVHAMTKAELDRAYGILEGHIDPDDPNSTYETVNGEMLTDYNLFAIGIKENTSNYAAYYVATAMESIYLWNVRYAGGIVYTSSEHGVRPVTTLKNNVLLTGGSGTSSNPYTVSLAQ